MTERPKIGVALSGGSTKAVAHIGVLDVFTENGIPIDFLTGCSSGAIVASSYACGTIDELRQWAFGITRQEFLKYIKIPVESGYLMDTGMVAKLLDRFTEGKRFEDLKIRLGLVACDVETGETINLALGDISTACRASCTMPFVLPAVRWGNRILVDGGLSLLTPPVEQLREMGADITIGIDIAATRNMFTRQGAYIRGRFNEFKKMFQFEKLKSILRLKTADTGMSISDIEAIPSWFDILGKSVDVEIKRKGMDAKLAKCDLLLRPQVKHYKKIELGNARAMYEEGRRTALEAVPKIKELMAKYAKRADRSGVRINPVRNPVQKKFV